MSLTESFLGGIAFKNLDLAAVTILIVSESQSLAPPGKRLRPGSLEQGWVEENKHISETRLQNSKLVQTLEVFGGRRPKIGVTQIDK